MMRFFYDRRTSARHTARVILFSSCLLVAVLSAPYSLPAELGVTITAASAPQLRWVVPLGGMPKHCSPTLADLEGDGRTEILIGNYDGILYCFDPGGKVRWTYQTSGPIQSTPMAVDCDGDGKLEIFVGSHDGYLHGVNWEGRPLSQWGWPKFGGTAFGMKEVFPSPSCGDLDGDGDLEIVVGSWGHYITAWHYQGPMAWRYYNADTVWSSPACIDLDLDGKAEVIIGADCWGGPNWPWPRGGLLYAFRGDGSIMNGFPKTIPQVVWSSPAVGDLDMDGFPDVVVGTGNFWQNTTPGRSNYLSYADGKHVYAFDYRGNNLPGWPVSTEGNGFSSPALGDLDGDGLLEVVNACSDTWLYCWEHDGTLKWRTRTYACDKLGSPIIADVDGDGWPDVLLGEGHAVIAYDRNGRKIFEYNTHANIQNSPAVGDLDGDGYAEMVVAHGVDGEQGRLFCFQVGKRSPEAAWWPMFRRDPTHTASAPYREPPQAWDDEEIRSRAYLAEGYTGEGFDQFVLLMNPTEREMPAEIRFMLSSGRTVTRMLQLPPHSRTTFHVNPFVRGLENSIRVISPFEGLIVERAMYFRYSAGREKWSGGHDSLAMPSPSREWYFAEGCTRPGFHTWLCLQNPQDRDAMVTLRYMCGDGSNLTRQVRVRARSRFTVAVHQGELGIGVHDGPRGDVSVKVESDLPVVAERPVYFNYMGSWDGGHDVTGAILPSREWYFAEGCTRPGFHTWLCLQNPQDRDAMVTLRYMCGDGSNLTRQVRVRARSRFTVAVHQGELGIGVHDGPRGDVSVKVESDLPVVTERPVYFLFNGSIAGGSNTVGWTPLYSSP